MTLDAAWAEVEAALPDVWMAELVRRGAINGDTNPHTGVVLTKVPHRYQAVAQPQWEPFDQDGEVIEFDARADDPAAALLALAEKLRAIKP